MKNYSIKFDEKVREIYKTVNMYSKLKLSITERICVLKTAICFPIIAF